MLKKDELSIVIAVYNRERIVERTLRSVALQTYSPLHLILVDNASIDGTRQVLERWKSENESENLRVTLLDEPKRGACAARNRGLVAVESERMMFFDSDDTMRPELVAEYMAAFDASPQADMVVCRCLLHRLDGSLFPLKYSSCPTLDDQLYHSVLRTQGYAVRTSFMREVGAWNERLLAWNDWELGVRLLLAGPKIASVGKTLVDTYQLEDSITGLGFLSRTARWETALDEVESVLRSHDAEDKVRLVDYRRVVLAAHYKKEGADIEAQRLLRDVLNRISDNKKLLWLYKSVYRYVSAGGRGAASIFRLLVR